MKQSSTYILGIIPFRSRHATAAPERTTIRRIVVITSALPSVLCVLLAASGKISSLFAVGYVLGLFALWLTLYFWTPRWLTGLALLISTVNLIVISPELLLRAVDFQYTSKVSYGGLRPDRQMLFEPDRDLMWKFPTDQPGVNSLGFRDTEVRIPKPPGVRRILFLGDSCTDQDFAGYVEQLLNDHSAGDSLHYECVVMAVPGYSSYQGRIVAEKYGRMIQADVAFVYFGWNDHWLAYGGTDAEMGKSRMASLLRDVSCHSRLTQLAIKVSSMITDNSQGIVEQVRVPISEFRENLRAIDSVFSASGTRVIFVTAPSGHYRSGVPTYLIEQRFAPSEAFVLSKHREYCSIVRTVSARTFGGLLDLEKEFKALYNPDLFMNDGIHFTDSGLRVVAAMIYAFMLDRGYATAATFSNGGYLNQ